MTENKKRSYRSSSRNVQASQTRTRILEAAKKLFEAEGFEYVTIEKIAIEANISIPSIYSLFKSKRGVLRALLDESLSIDQFDSLVQKSIKEKSPKKRLTISAKIAREMYDAEKTQMNMFRSATVLAPEFKELEKEREMRRYHRQEVTIKAMLKEGSLNANLSETKARDILWAFTGRDIYRMLVIEQGWSSDVYEEWLSQLLINNLVNNKAENQ